MARRRAARKHRVPTARWFALAVATAVLALAAWRWIPRPSTPATDTMKSASESLIAAAPAESVAPEPPDDPSTDRERLMETAFDLRGIPYEWGGKGPDSFDCSGFTKAAYAAIDVDLPDGSFNQAEGEQPLDSPGDLEAGDLIFYRWAGNDQVTHVTMSAGDGWVIGTGSPGQPKEVVVYPLSDDLIDDGRVLTYRHIELKDE